jgi:hypothetical protein
MGDENTKPLLPRNATSATIIAIPLAALLGGFGWVAEKVLTIDEAVVSIQKEQERDKDINNEFKALKTLVTVLKSEMDSRSTLVQTIFSMNDKIAHISERIEYVEKEQERRREKVYKQSLEGVNMPINFEFFDGVIPRQK